VIHKTAGRVCFWPAAYASRQLESGRRSAE